MPITINLKRSKQIIFIFSPSKSLKGYQDLRFVYSTRYKENMC